MKTYIFIALLFISIGAAFGAENQGIVLSADTLVIPSGDTLTIDAGTDFFCYGDIQNEGTIIINGWFQTDVDPESIVFEAHINNSGIILIGETGEIHNYHGEIRNTGKIINNGIYANSYGETYNDGTFDNYNYIFNEDPFYNHQHLNNYGYILTMYGLHNEGLLDNKGNITNCGLFINSGTLYNSGVIESVVEHITNEGMIYNFDGTIPGFVEGVPVESNPYGYIMGDEDNITAEITTSNEDVTSVPDELSLADSVEVPEFPTMVLPVVAILGLAFTFQRRKE
jgi:hypothetical protein